jgi:hypothetical protein
MAYPARNISTHQFPNVNSGNILKEDGGELLQENGDGILLENPTQTMSFATRNIATVAAYPTRN